MRRPPVAAIEMMLNGSPAESGFERLRSAHNTELLGRQPA
jgi:hypothetical protein